MKPFCLRVLSPLLLISAVLPYLADAQTQAGFGVRFQENADCGGRGKGTHADVANLDQLPPGFGISCIDVIAMEAHSYVVFYSEPNFQGDELWVRGASRETNIAGLRRTQCVRPGVVDYWNDAIRSVKFQSGTPPACATVIGTGATQSSGSRPASNAPSTVTYHNGSTDSVLYVYATFERQGTTIHCGSGTRYLGMLRKDQTFEVTVPAGQWAVVRFQRVENSPCDLRNNKFESHVTGKGGSDYVSIQ
jgi:hypothetical protein